MSDVVVPTSKRETSNMGGVKRDYQGKEKKSTAGGDGKVRDVQQQQNPRNAYTPMFERFRDELDEHHDRRMKIQKVSRDVTALSKKMCVYPPLGWFL